MRIIDFRARPSTPEFIAIARTRLFADHLVDLGVYPQPQSVADLIREMDAAGVAVAVVEGRDLETTFGFQTSNDHVAACVRQYPDRLIPFAGIDPNKGMGAVREVERAVRELGFRGVSLNPYMHKLPASDRMCYPVYAKCVELGVPVTITSGLAVQMPEVAIDHCSPREIDIVARDFPELTLLPWSIVNPWAYEAIGIAQRHKNVYVQLGCYWNVPGWSVVVEAVNTVLQDRCVFGSGYPTAPFHETLAAYAQMPFTDAAREKLMYKNAARILGLDD